MRLARFHRRLRKTDDAGRRKPELKLVGTVPAKATLEKRATVGWLGSQGHLAYQGRLAPQARGKATDAKKPGQAKSSFWKLPSFSIAKIARKAMFIAAGAALILVLSAAMILGYFKITKSDYFLVKPETISVSGLRRVTRMEVLKAAGLDRPQNLLSIDASASMAALKSLPWVESAELVRYFPDGISVTVSEYEPKALVALDNLYYMDERGRPFKRLDPGENPSLPIVSGFEIDDLLSGGPLVLDAVSEVLFLMELLSSRTDEFRLANVSEIHYDPDRGVTVFTRDGELEIKVGAGAFAEKLIRLGRVAAYLKLDDRLGDFEYLNLDCPPRVTGRLKKGRQRAAPEPAGA